LSDKYAHDHGDRCSAHWATGCQFGHSVGAGLAETSVSAELTQTLVVVRRGTPHSSRLGLQRLLLLMLKSAPMTLPTGMRLNSLFAF